MMLATDEELKLRLPQELLCMPLPEWDQGEEEKAGYRLMHGKSNEHLLTVEAELQSVLPPAGGALLCCLSTPHPKQRHAFKVKDSSGRLLDAHIAVTPDAAVSSSLAAGLHYRTSKLRFSMGRTRPQADAGLVATRDNPECGWAERYVVSYEGLRPTERRYTMRNRATGDAVASWTKLRIPPSQGGDAGPSLLPFTLSFLPPLPEVDRLAALNAALQVQFASYFRDRL